MGKNWRLLRLEQVDTKGFQGLQLLCVGEQGVVLITQLDAASRLLGCEFPDDGIQGATVMAVCSVLGSGDVIQV